MAHYLSCPVCCPQAVGVSSPFDWPLLWLHHALPPDIKRAVLIPSDTLVRTDLRELAFLFLDGKPAAAFEDCSLSFESLFNYRHALFKGIHGRSSCSVDPELLVIDLKAWKKEVNTYTNLRYIYIYIYLY